jgi:hypothetical protein
VFSDQTVADGDDESTTVATRAAAIVYSCKLRTLPQIASAGARHHNATAGSSRLCLGLRGLDDINKVLKGRQMVVVASESGVHGGGRLLLFDQFVRDRTYSHIPSNRTSIYQSTVLRCRCGHLRCRNSRFSRVMCVPSRPLDSRLACHLSIYMER